MNINCVICSDVFLPSSEVHITPCGHIFHYVCLVNWLERSKTCPQCRNKTTEKNIHRIYFNLANTDHIVDDAATLQFKLDNLQFQIKLKEKDITNFKEKYKKVKNQNIGLREELAKAESDLRTKVSAIHALQEQVKYFKNKVKENDRMSDEVLRLKEELRNFENIQLAISGTRTEVNDMLKSEKNTESLVILAATLKKTLLDAEKKKRDLEYKSKHMWNEVTSKRQECQRLQSENTQLKEEIESGKLQWEQEKSFLKNKISALDKKISQSTSESPNPLIQRIVMESPAPLPQRPQLGYKPSIDLTETSFVDLSESLPVNEAVQGIMDSDSPYLPVKQSNVGIAYPTLMNTKFSTKSNDSSKYSIFKKTPLKIENVKINKPSDCQAYNGLGGTSKVDLFPSPKAKPSFSIKRKNSSSISSAKFKKLAPNVSDFKL